MNTIIIKSFRIIRFLIILLIFCWVTPSLSLAKGKPTTSGGSGTTNGGDTEASSSRRLPSCLKPMTSRPTLGKYVTYLESHDNVTKAMNACRWKDEVLQWFFDKLEAAETANMPPDAPLPDEFLTTDTERDYSVVGGAQSFEIIGAKLAHILFIEVRQMVPWRLHQYDGTALATLFKVCNTHQLCTDSIPQTGSFVAYNVVDHSPREAWNLANQVASLGTVSNQKEAMAELLKHARSFRHGGIFYDSSGNIIKQDNIGIVTLSQMAEEKVSRSGCHSMSPYLVRLGTAINLPGEEVFEVYGPGHETAYFKSADLVLAHGDDPYSALLDNTPSGHVLDSYSRWEQEVFTYSQEPDDESFFNARKHFNKMARIYPSHYLMKNYCSPSSSYASGREYLEVTFSYKGRPYATPEEFDALEAKINSLTSSCTIFPTDNPDG